jgi:ABC-type sugar transport system ATPase subunit
VGKRFGDVVALADFNLDVEQGELVTVLGPSGCGKSTLLRLAAGLEPPTDGSIHVGGRRIDHLPPHERDVAMVFQSYALYPHMTVRGNIEFPLRMRNVARAERARRADEVAALLEIGNLLDRRPAALSGGQRQRVALARALVRNPALFLLDEPLSNLDARLRTSVRQSIRAVQRRLHVTTLYVTHDQVEALTLGDRVVVMDRGHIQQVDPPEVVYARPANTFVATFVGTPAMNLLEARWEAGTLHVGDQEVRLPSLRFRLGDTARPVVIGVRPEAFDAERGLVAEVDASSREVLGGETLLRGRVGTTEVSLRLPGSGRDVPERVVAAPSSFHVFDATTGARLGP